MIPLISAKLVFLIGLFNVYVLFLLVPERKLRNCNYSVEDTVIYVLEPGSDSELTDLFDADDSGGELDLETDRIDPGLEVGRRRQRRRV